MSEREKNNNSEVKVREGTREGEGKREIGGRRERWV